ncbi:hypothetical protein C8F01DRAFT_1266151 [Mycena amicta]|nr:hypothetical protein C8F01DRAFT_1266151 [Mycena amicta]
MSSNASSQRTSTRERVTELEDIVVQLQRQIAALELRHRSLEPTARDASVPAHPPTAPASEPAPEPVQTSVPASPNTASVLSLPSFPSSTSSSLTTGSSTPVSATPDGVYVYSSRAQPPTPTTSWAEAHAGSQGRPGGQARRIDSPTRTLQRKRSSAYHVVFRGHEIGVFHKEWPRVQRALTGFRCAVYKGYDQQIDANTAFANAQRRGYTSTRPQAVGKWAVDLDKMPLPVQHDDPQVVGSERLLGRCDGEACIEAALNTSGISSSGHLSKPTFVDALVTFRDAERAGNTARVTELAQVE